MRRILVLVLTLTLAGIRVHAGPERFTGTPAAKAEFDKGKALEGTNEWAQAALAYRRAWTIDPEFADAHDAYSWARQREALGDISKLDKMNAEEKTALHERTIAMETAVHKEYEDLIAAHPKAPIYKWAQAQHYNETNIDLQGKLCKETVDMDPMFTPGYRCLATVAGVRGDFDIATDSLRHVMKLDGESPELWLRLVRSQREVPAKYKALTKNSSRVCRIQIPQRRHSSFGQSLCQRQSASRHSNDSSLSIRRSSSSLRRAARRGSLRCMTIARRRKQRRSRTR
jgi:hypothetical protein